jgi:hypothetical protein
MPFFPAKVLSLFYIRGNKAKEVIKLLILDYLCDLKIIFLWIIRDIRDFRYF